jgi:hypothetical protein
VGGVAFLARFAGELFGGVVKSPELSRARRRNAWRAGSSRAW